MKTFDLNRFWMTLRWSFLNEQKYILRTFVTMAVIYFLCIGMNSGLFYGFHGPVQLHSIITAAGLCGVVWSVAGAKLTSELFNILRTKQGRTAFFMLPASNAEKFWSRVAYVLILGTVVSTAALIAADLVHMLVSWIFAGNAISTTYHTFEFGKFIDAISYHSDNLLAAILGVTGKIGLIMAFVTSYILGGTIFRRMPVALSTLCWLAFLFVGGVAMGMLAEFIKWQDIDWANIEVDFWFGPDLTTNLIANIIVWGMTAFFICTARRCFDRKQVC